MFLGTVREFVWKKNPLISIALSKGNAIGKAKVTSAEAILQP